MMMSDKQRTVICYGDGGLDGKIPFMDLYVLAQSGKKLPKVCFFGTASGDNMGQTKYFERLFERYPCVTSSLSLFNPHTADIEDFIMSKDVIIVGGGHSKSMLILWKGYGLDHMLRSAYENGTVLSGGSAGSVCWFDQCITDSIPGRLSVMDCLGILPYSNCPHFASETRRDAYGYFVSTGQIKGGYAADDHAALHFVDGKLFRSVSNRPYAKTYKVEMQNGKLVQKRLRTKWLGLKENQDAFIFNSPMFEQEPEPKADVPALPAASESSIPIDIAP